MGKVKSPVLVEVESPITLLAPLDPQPVFVAWPFSAFVSGATLQGYNPFRYKNKELLRDNKPFLQTGNALSSQGNQMKQLYHQGNSE